jgi:Helicase associated domain
MNNLSLSLALQLQHLYEQQHLIDQGTSLSLLQSVQSNPFAPTAHSTQRHNGSIPSQYMPYAILTSHHNTYSSLNVTAGNRASLNNPMYSSYIATNLSKSRKPSPAALHQLAASYAPIRAKRSIQPVNKVRPEGAVINLHEKKVKSIKAPSVWDEMYATLKVFRQKHGNCVVPKHYTDIRLAVWVTYFEMEQSLRLFDCISS